MEAWTIRGHLVEYDDATHEYLVDGVIVPSVTQILKLKFGGMYDNVSASTLKKASERGTAIHKEIEQYNVNGVLGTSQEFKDYLFLEKYHAFDVCDSEIPLLLEYKERFICGRCDMVLYDSQDNYSIADIKTTATLNKEYLGYQLGLYKLAYEYSYNDTIELYYIDKLYAIHLKNGKRKFLEIPYKESLIIELLEEWRKKYD